MDVTLEGQVALVIGGKRGIAGAAARRFAQEGARVVLMGRSVEPEAQLGEGVAGVRGDVTNADDVARAVSESVTRFGRLDVLVNAAGVLGPMAPIGDADVPEEWIRAVQVNLVGTYLACRAAVPVMTAAGYGRIVNFASRAVTVDPPGQSAYNASKAAVVSLTRTLAAEVESRGVRANVLCPGNVDSPLSDDFLSRDARALAPEQRENQRAFQELRAQGLIWRPDEVLDTVVFLASRASDHVNGQFVLLRVRGRDDPPAPGRSG